MAISPFMKKSINLLAEVDPPKVNSIGACPPVALVSTWQGQLYFHWGCRGVCAVVGTGSILYLLRASGTAWVCAGGGANFQYHMVLLQICIA